MKEIDYYDVDILLEKFKNFVYSGLPKFQTTLHDE